jgi:hypothetical protein
VVDGDQGGRGSADWVPRPDPTKLTTDAVTAATDQFRRELSSVRDLLEHHIDNGDDTLRARIDAMQESDALRLDSIKDVRPATERLINHLRELHDERFAGIARQFVERDARMEMASRAAKEALDAALQAAKELVGQQNKTTAEAASKAELSFTKQIEQIDLRIRTLQEGFDARLTEIKERIDRGEGGKVAVAETRTERRLDTGLAVTVILAVLAALGIIATIVIAMSR